MENSPNKFKERLKEIGVQKTQNDGAHNEIPPQNTINMALSWKVLLVIGLLGHAVGYYFTGIIPASIGIIGDICFLLGIVNFFTSRTNTRSTSSKRRTTNKTLAISTLLSFIVPPIGLYILLKALNRLMGLADTKTNQKISNFALARATQITLLAAFMAFPVMLIFPDSDLAVPFIYVLLIPFWVLLPWSLIRLYRFPEFAPKILPSNDNDKYDSGVFQSSFIKNITVNFFRYDLNLKDRWWHRLLFVAFVVAFIYISWATVSNMLDDAQLPKYTKVGMLSDRMDLEIHLIGSLVKPGEKIAEYEHGLYGEYQGKKLYDGNGGWLVKQEYYCSEDISNQVEKISEKTGINNFCGNMCFVSKETFKIYLKQNNASCISVNSYNPLDDGETRKKLMWGLEAKGMAVWQESLVKSIFAVLQTIFFVALGFITLLVLYYKVCLYIVFGSKKDVK